MIKKFMNIIFAILVVVAVVISILNQNKLYEIVNVEAGTETLNVSQFIKNEKNLGTFITDLSTIDMSVPGVYEIEIQVGRRAYSSMVNIEDTVAPVAEVINQEIWAKEEIEAKEFVEKLVDATEVKIYFKEQPDFSKAGVQKVAVILEDASENKTELEASLTVKEDTEPPEINGAADQDVYIGKKVYYKKGVTVTDNRDEHLELVVDSSAVNLKKPGYYDVVYTATDSSGNSTTKTVKLKMKEIPKGYVDKDDLDKLDELDELADKVLATIIKDGMSQTEKAKAIYKWTRSHIGYANHSDKSDWIKAAYQGIQKASGDCFVYYATAQELLTRAGIENQGIVKLGGGHYWNLVNIGKGWYHFDTTPRSSGGEFFMLTDAEIEKYSKSHKNSHKWDKSKYPATPLK